MEDPWPELEAEVQRQLASVGAGVTRWRIIKSSEERVTIKSSLLRQLTEIDVDLQDMAATVEIATKEPHKFNLDATELQHRREFVHSSQTQTLEVRAELTEGEEGGSAVMHERQERRVLLGTPGSGGGKASRQGGSDDKGAHTRSNARQDAVEQANEGVIQQQMVAQQTALDQQEEQLGILSGVMDRLGRMGKTINEELKAQSRALDEFTSEVDETQGKMRNAMQVMNKMLRNKENGKFCAILVLSIVLIILLFLVFS